MKIIRLINIGLLKCKNALHPYNSYWSNDPCNLTKIFHIGDTVWWEDPDGICSGKYEIVDMNLEDGILVLSNGSSIVEAYDDECVPPIKKLINRLIKNLIDRLI